MDALSEALRAVRLSGSLFLNAELTAPWGFLSPAPGPAAPLLAPGTEHLVMFHLVSEGKAVARVAGHPDVPLGAGDVVVLPNADAHELWNGRGAARVDARSVLPKILSGSLALEQGGGGGAMTRFVCGYFGCERYAARLFLAGLPPVFKVNLRSDAAGAWIESSIRRLVTDLQSGRAGRRALLAKMSEALFVETLCLYMDGLPARRTGWLAAARDEIVGAAMACIHRNPERAWSLAALAKEAGSSRTVVVERFRKFLGQPPLAYLTLWRLQLAAQRLETTERSILEVALEVGYNSEAAFNRAFKRLFALPPARYRRSRRRALETDRAEAAPPFS